jgi:transposase-like protein
MRQKSVPEKEPATQVVKNRRATRRHFSAEDKIRIVLEGLRGEDSIAELCRREGIVPNLYYRWSKDFFRRGRATGWRYGPGRDVGRGQEPASRDRRLQHQRRAA